MKGISHTSIMSKAKFYGPRDQNLHTLNAYICNQLQNTTITLIEINVGSGKNNIIISIQI